MIVSLPTAESTRACGRRIAGLLRAGDVVVLTGDLGAGKTTLAQGIGAGLGVRGEVTSPTFVIARVHPSLTEGPDLVHVDAYRLGSTVEVDDLDLDADVADAVTVVEWGEGLVEGLAADRLELVLSRRTGGEVDDLDGDEDGADADEARTLEVRGVGPRWDGVDLAAALAEPAAP